MYQSSMPKYIYEHVVSSNLLLTYKPTITASLNLHVDAYCLSRLTHRRLVLLPTYISTFTASPCL